MLRFFLAIVAVHLTSTLALPIPAGSETNEAYCPEHPAVEILSYDTETKATHLRFDCQDCFEADSEPDNTSLSLTLQAPECDSPESVECLQLVINGEALQVQGDSFDSTLGSSRVTLTAYDISGAAHTLEGKLSVGVTSKTKSLDSTSIYSSSFLVDIVDGRRVARYLLAFEWEQNDSRSWNLLDISYVPAHSVTMQTATRSCMGAAPASEASTETSSMDDAAAERYLAGELETLRVLEEEALRLQNEIAVRKQDLSLGLAEYRTQKPLQELIDRCDGIVCAAQQIATRIYDHLNLATTHRLDRKDVQHTLQAPSRVNVTRLSYDSQQQAQNHTWSDSAYLSEVRIADSYFTKALAFIAGILGLTALFMFIRRKCMSMRGRVERAADREERRTARAYRRAARRAEMRKRLSCFMPTISFFAKKQQQTRMTSHDEKRALALQDALLEQDFRQLEKGDVMEAEIRQFRNASAIVASIVRGGGKEGLMLVRDPPPSQIPLPGARSRASTATLPSYNSEDLPDYSSLPEATGYNTTTDGFAYYRPTDSMQDSVVIGPASVVSSSNTRSTPISSMPNISRRPSQVTLGTRSSRVGSLGSI